MSRTKKKTANNAIAEERIALMRSDFIGGATLRQLASKYGISLASVGAISSREGWVEKRETEQLRAIVPEIIESTDKRVALVAKNAGEKIVAICDQIQNISGEVVERLSKADFSETDLRDLVVITKTLNDTWVKLQEESRAMKASGARLAVTLNLDGKAMIQPHHCPACRRPIDKVP